MNLNMKEQKRFLKRNKKLNFEKKEKILVIKLMK
jgi:hypothetical protein